MRVVGLAGLMICAICALALAAAAAPAGDTRSPAGAPAAEVAPAAESAPAAAAPFGGETYALIVSGVCKDAMEGQEQQSITSLLQKTLVESCKLPPDRVTVLTGGSPLKPDYFPGPTAEMLAAAIQKAADTIGPEDRFIFYYRGQANVVNDTLRINLQGPDISGADLANELSAVKCASMVVVLDCPNAGLAVQELTGPGRIIIFGARGDQPYATRFSGEFVPALTNGEADFDHDGRITLLEAYRLAVTRIDAQYLKEGLLKSENALLEDDGDGVPTHQPWEHIEESFDGAAAAQVALYPPAEQAAERRSQR